MPTGVSTYGADQLIGAIFGEIYLVPDVFYMALMSQMPDPSNNGSQLREPPAVDGDGNPTSYERKAVPNNAATWNTPEGGIVTNKISLIYPQATGDWGVISHYALCTTSNKPTTDGQGNPVPADPGQFILFGALDTARRIPKDHSARFDPGLLAFAVTGTRQSIVGSG